MNMERDYTEVAEILKVLGHADRLKMVKGLCANECNVSKIQDKLGLSQATVSQHLSILKRMGIVEGVRDKNRVCYSVKSEFVRKLLGVI